VIVVRDQLLQRIELLLHIVLLADLHTLGHVRLDQHRAHSAALFHVFERERVRATATEPHEIGARALIGEQLDHLFDRHEAVEPPVCDTCQSLPSVALH
jgi:hypothetical protein